MTARKIVDCHVNIWDDRHLLPAFAEQTATARSGGSVGVRADADTLYRAMADVDQDHLLAAIRGLGGHRRR